MSYLKQSTAKTLRFGPFVDENDGKTAETALTISQADIRLSKNGGAFAQSNDAGGATHDENGWYSLQLDATDTNTLGPLTVAIHVSGALPVYRHFTVIPANIYDSLVAGSDYLLADVVQVEGADATDQIRDAMKLAPSPGAPAAGSVDQYLIDIVADTNELQSDWTDGGRLDTILDALSPGEPVNVEIDVTEVTIEDL